MSHLECCNGVSSSYSALFVQAPTSFLRAEASSLRDLLSSLSLSCYFHVLYLDNKAFGRNQCRLFQFSLSILKIFKVAKNYFLQLVWVIGIGIMVTWQINDRYSHYFCHKYFMVKFVDTCRKQFFILLLTLTVSSAVQIFWNRCTKRLFYW